MTIYLDTSVIVAALTSEAKSAAVRSWIGASAQQLAVSEWTITEFSSAVSIKIRSGRLLAENQHRTLAMFNRTRIDSLETVTFAPTAFRDAARMADQHELKLRGGDALHLALCAYHHLELCTLDGKQADAANVLGIPTTLL